VLKNRIKELEHCEAELAPWKEREADIKHYLNTFTQVVELVEMIAIDRWLG